MALIPRRALLEQLTASLNTWPVTLLIGPRQCGKTTLAREIYRLQGGTFFDLEDPETPLRRGIAKLILKNLKGLVVIDEFQRQPELFELLRVLVDREKNPARFLVLGSASLDLVRGVSESLAGRVAYVHIGGFDFTETGPASIDRLWLRGSFPKSFLAKDEQSSYSWRLQFVQSFLERDIPLLGIRIPSTALRRFWLMVAHMHGQVWNAADLARSMDVKEDTARKYLDILTGSFMVRQLLPWFENVGKRLVKAPKVYIRDSGIVHALLGLKALPQVQSHPKLGLLWEGFALEQVLRLMGTEGHEYFYKTHGGAELDLLIFSNGKRHGFEFKYTDRPASTRSMHVVLKDLGLEKLWVVYPGEQRYPLSEGIEVLPLTAVQLALQEKA
jgi:uncharacterized protein